MFSNEELEKIGHAYNPEHDEVFTYHVHKKAWTSEKSPTVLDTKMMVWDSSSAVTGNIFLDYPIDELGDLMNFLPVGPVYTGDVVISYIEDTGSITITRITERGETAENQAILSRSDNSPLPVADPRLETISKYVDEYTAEKILADLEALI